MTTQIILTFVVLGITILLFVKEWLRVDVVALCVMLVVAGTWDHLRQLSRDPSFDVLTPTEGEESDPSKAITAALCFAGAIALAIAGFPLSISLMSGAVWLLFL